MQAEEGGARKKSTTMGSVVLFPFMAHGHLTPFLHFARLLHSRHPDLHLTLASTPSNILLLRSSRLLPPSLRLAELPFHHPYGENTDSLSRPQISIFFYSSESLLRPAFDSLLVQLHPPVSCVVSDMCLAWSVDVSRAHGAFHAVLYTSGPYAMSIYNSIWTHLPHRTRGLANAGDGDEDEVLLLPDLPGVSIRMSQLSNNMKNATEDSSSSKFVRRQAELCRGSEACLFNTAVAIEGRSLEHWRRSTGQPAWAVGPLGMFSPPALTTGKQPSVSPEACTEWLDRHPVRSVLYVCFGSMSSLSTAQMAELARGLEASGRPFIWVIRAPIGYDASSSEIRPEWLPEGFEGRVTKKGQGLLVGKWAPQVEILAHGSTGAFLSHCGWNSVLESLSWGVPLLGWPLASEQFYNSKLLEEEVGVCREVARGVDQVVAAEVVAEAAREMLGGQRGEEMRRKAAALKRELEAGVSTESGGASIVAADEFLQMVAGWRRKI